MIDLEAKFDDSGEHTILIVDDLEDNVVILKAFLDHHNYQTLVAYSGKKTIEILEEHRPDLILLDLNMPEMNGLEVLKQIRSNEEYNNTGIVLLTASGDIDKLLESFSMGADDFIQKPYHHIEMLARIQSVLKMRDTQMKLREVNKRLDEFNAGLEKTIKTQVDELEKASRLKRYLSPQIAEAFSHRDTEPFDNTQQEVTIVFLDLRNFTSFAESHDPSEVMTVLQELHSTVGPVIFEHNATLERFTGDGLMCFMGAPYEIDNHPEKAYIMAVEMQKSVEDLSRQWTEKGFGIALGIGMSTGMASTGTIGFKERLDYAAIGSVTNLAARLCGIAKGGEILVSESTWKKLNGHKDQLDMRGEMEFKGFTKKIKVYGSYVH